MSEHIIKTEMSNGALFIPYQSKLSESVLEEIVRCRDCRHYHSYQDLCERLKPGMVVMGDGYCKWGERRSE